MKPFKCPICDGKGLVPASFYTIQPYSTPTTAALSKHLLEQAAICKACGGKGIVWPPVYSMPESIAP